MGKILSPGIAFCEKSIEILGEADGLMALGELLIVKAKLRNSISTTFNDGINLPINITIREDIMNDDGSIVGKPSVKEKENKAVRKWWKIL